MKAMNTVSRWLAPSVLAIAMGFGFAMPAAPAQAQDLGRVLVDIADVVFQSGVPYYRYGNYNASDRLVVQTDRYGRPVYYRYAPPAYQGRQGQPYGNAYGYWNNGRDNRDRDRDVSCNKHGKCKVTYYDRRYDHDGHRWWDGHRWHDDD